MNVTTFTLNHHSHIFLEKSLFLLAPHTAYYRLLYTINATQGNPCCAHNSGNKQTNRKALYGQKSYFHTIITLRETTLDTLWALSAYLITLWEHTERLLWEHSANIWEHSGHSMRTLWKSGKTDQTRRDYSGNTLQLWEHSGNTLRDHPGHTERASRKKSKRIFI